MSDINFITDGAVERVCARRRHDGEVLREGFAQKAKHLQDDAERSLDYCRDMVRGRYDVTDELQELEAFANGLLLAVLLLKHQAKAE